MRKFFDYVLVTFLGLIVLLCALLVVKNIFVIFLAIWHGYFNRVFLLVFLRTMLYSAVGASVSKLGGVISKQLSRKYRKGVSEIREL